MSYVVLESRLYIICTIYIVWGDGSLRERAAASALHNLRYTYEYTSRATQWEYGEKGCCTYGTRHRDLFSLLPHIGSFVAGRIQLYTRRYLRDTAQARATARGHCGGPARTVNRPENRTAHATLN